MPSFSGSWFSTPPNGACGAGIRQLEFQQSEDQGRYAAGFRLDLNQPYRSHNSLCCVSTNAVIKRSFDMQEIIESPMRKDRAKKFPERKGKNSLMMKG